MAAADPNVKQEEDMASPEHIVQHFDESNYKKIQKCRDLNIEYISRVEGECFGLNLLWRAFFSTYNKLTEKCFVDCVHDFTTKKVSKSETSCSLNCLKKYYEVSHRITQKISEFEVAKLKEFTQ